MTLINFLTYISLWILQNSNSITSATEIGKSIRHTDVAIRENIQDFTKCTYLEAKTFKQLVQNSNLFVDTSLFIKEALAIMNQLNIIIMPPNFGRSINLDMYKTFLQLPLDSDGNPTAGNDDPTYKLFKFGDIELERGEKVKLQKPLQISKYDDIFEKYQGKFPVIYVNFTHLTAKNITHMEQQIWQAIRQAYQNHAYLKEFLEQSQQETEALIEFKNILEGNETTVDLTNSLVFLSDQLVKKFPNKKVVVLIDDEDVPVNCLRSHYAITKREIGKMYNLMYNFLMNTFMSNPHLHHGLITGTEHLTRGSTNYEKLRARNIIRKYDPPSHYFGLTNTTLYLLSDQLKVPVPPWSMNELLQSDSPKDWWYQGKSWLDENQNTVYVEFGAVMKYLMKEHDGMRRNNP